MDKLIITVAPTGSVPRKKDTPHVPVTPDEIAETAYRCEQEGAAIIDVQCRDEDERPTCRLDIFQETVGKIRKRTKLVVMTSTSGIAGQTDEDRATPLRTNPEMGSLTTGTLNFAGRKPSVVYVNTPETVQFLAKAMLDQKIKPELEAFDVGFVQQGMRLIDSGLVEEPAHFQLVMGVDGGVPATPENLLHMRNQLPPTATYVVAGMSRMQLPMTTMAIVLGGHVRVGLEDNLYLKKGVLARNEELVARARHLAEDLQREVASPDEARAIMGLGPRRRSRDSGQALLERFERLADRGFVVGRGQIERLPGFHENPSSEQGGVEDAPARFVRSERVPVVAGQPIRKQDREDGSHCGDHRRHIVVLQKFLETGSQGARRLEEGVEDTGLLELIESRQPGGHRHRIPGERTAVEELPARRIREVKDVRTSEERPAGQASSNDLAEAGEVRCHAIRVLGPAERHPKAAHHLVEDERDVVVRRDFPQPFQELGVRCDVRPLDRFHDYACETVRVFPNPRLSLVQIVEGQHDRIFQDRVGRPARSRDRYQASLHLLV